MSQTLGQQRVKAEFNPAKNDLVDQIKNKSAELIDLIESMRPRVEMDGSENATITSDIELTRLLDKSQMDVETACMYAVKACFTK